MTDEVKKSTLALKDTSLFFVIVAACMAHWSILALRIPILDRLPYWKFKLGETPIHWSWIAIALIAMSLAVLISYSNVKPTLKLLALILLGASMQFSFAFSKGMGLDGIRDRIVNSGHTEFADVAMKQPGLLYAAQNYEALAMKKRYGFIPSKPPGTLLFYIMTERVANLWAGNFTPQRHQNLNTFASIAWPILSYLVIIPLYYLARILYKESIAISASLFYLPIPAINLITLHTDQVIYPLLGILPILLITLAVDKNSLWLAFVSGAALYFAVYFSFGLAVMGFFLILPFARINNAGWYKNLIFTSRFLSAAALAIVTSDLLARKFLNYDIVYRYAHAIKHHADWVIWENNVSTLLNSSLTNLVEFMVFVGIPLSILLIAATIQALKQLGMDRELTPSSILPSLLFGVLGFLLAFGKIKAETARLWIFLIPVVCLIAADFLENKPWQKNHKGLFVLSVILFEFVTTYLTLRHQDFR